MTLPASLDVVGWISLGIIALAFILYFIKRQLSKPDDRSHHVILLNLFPVVHIPRELSREEAEKIANALRDVYVITWAKLSSVYNVSTYPMPVSVIGSTMSEVSSEHPHILWLAPRDKVYLRIQDSMYYWFALELHNMFRYTLYGMGGIYPSEGGQGIHEAEKAVKWIKEKYSEAS